MGNWKGDDNHPGLLRVIDPDGAGPQPALDVPFTHDVLANNVLSGVTEDGVTTALTHDEVGNLTFDGTRRYLYDGFNRLIEIRVGGVAIQKLRHDGLGRLTEVVWPWADGARYELHLYYDGVRRIQEIRRLVQPAPIPTTTTWTEYIYGAGYVDEFVLAASPACAAQYIHQDANYNVVAQTDIEGNVICQSTWSPYGELLDHDVFDGREGTGMLAIGHQGLFYVPFLGAVHATSPHEMD